MRPWSCRDTVRYGAQWRLNKEWGAALEYAYFGKAAGLVLGQTTLSAVCHS